MARRLISRAELSRLAGVSDVAISKACKGRLAAACQGKMVDADHAAVLEYLAGKGKKPLSPGSAPAELAPPGDSRRRRKAHEPKKRATKTKRSDPAPTSDVLDEDDEGALASVDLSETGEPSDDWTLRRITDVYGTHTKFIRWLDARKKLADIKEKDLKNEETEGKLIERELVKTHVFAAIDSVFRRLLSDSPKKLARTIYAAAKSGRPVEEAEKLIRDDISSQLTPLKLRAAQVLRGA